MTAVLALVPRWVWAAAVAALTTISCKLTVDLGAVKLELEKTKVVYERERAHQATVLALAHERARQAEQTLTAKAANIREVADEQVTVARADADALRRRLRVEAANAATSALVSSTTAPARVTTTAVGPGEVFPSGTGDDLVPLALRAEEIRADAQACRRQYEAARSANEALNVNHEKAAVQARDQP